ncbi:MAG: S8 family serine peptidase [Candidatus Ornithomonoglobus sp.]
MKKILISLAALLTLCFTAAEAETIYTKTAGEYADIMQKYSPPREASPFAMGVQSDESQNILLAAYDGSLEDCGALYDICDEYNIHTLIYETSGDADAAYEYYSENGIPVCYNETMTLEASRPTKYLPYLSWGAGYVNTSWLSSQLELHFGSVGNMPEITVVEIDSGIDYTHPELSGRIDTSHGYDYFNDDNDPMDDNSHGTHVAGIIADNTLSNVKIIPLKVSDASGNFNTTQLKAALQKANELKPSVINMSIGTIKEDHACAQKGTFYELFNTAYANNTIICTAAGNRPSGSAEANNADYIFPAYMDNVITVANSTSAGGISSTSNYGSVIELAAPGDGIDSTIPVSKGSYGIKSGTSMACPFVTAAVAMLRTYYEDITYENTVEILQAHTTPFSVTPSKSYGSGILNMKGLIPEITPIPTPTAEPTETPEPTLPPTETPEPTPLPTVVPDDYGISVNIENIGNGTIYITATREIPDFCSLYIAEYDENGILLRLVKNGGQAIVHPSETASYIKVFLWDNAHNNLPIINAETYSLTDEPVEEASEKPSAEPSELPSESDQP